jgi:alkylhydroperoxidase family enzyme
MPRIEPIPYEELPEDVRQRIEAGLATGMYSVTLPQQILAHSPMVVRAMDEGYKAHFRTGAIEPRLQELIRLRSAQLNSCEPCGASRKEESVTEDDIACLMDLDPERYSRREYLALRFLDLFALDHHAIGDDTYREMAEELTPEEIVEIGWLCAQSLGVHRFMHTLDIFGTSDPVVRRRAAMVSGTDGA